MTSCYICSREGDMMLPPICSACRREHGLGTTIGGHRPPDRPEGVPAGLPVVLSHVKVGDVVCDPGLLRSGMKVGLPSHWTSPYEATILRRSAWSEGGWDLTDGRWIPDSATRKHGVTIVALPPPDVVPEGVAAGPPAALGHVKVGDVVCDHGLLRPGMIVKGPSSWGYPGNLSISHRASDGKAWVATDGPGQFEIADAPLRHNGVTIVALPVDDMADLR